MPKVSVIIPTYNSRNTVEETIRSVLKQSLTDLEIIVIDDGSQDDTIEVVKSIAEPQIKLFAYENGGVAVARNRGIANSTGEFITFLDADDLWTSDKLAMQVEALEQNAQAKVAYSWTNYIDEQGKFLFSGPPVLYKSNVYPQLLQTCFLTSGSNILVRKDVLNSVGGFNPKFFYTADWDFYLRLAKNFDFAVVPKYQILYRQSANSMSSKIEKLKEESLLVLNENFKTAPSELNSLKPKSHSILYLYCASLYQKKTNIKDRKCLVSAKKDMQASIRLYPRILLRYDTYRIIIKLILWELSFIAPINFLMQL